jgi:hypothetical protein
MPIKREKRGRGYIVARHFVVDGELTPEETRELDERRATMAAALSLEGKITTAWTGATAELERAEMPTDPNDPMYSSEWCRANERRSRAWFAVMILRSIHNWAACRDRGDWDGAEAECMAIGALVAQMAIVDHMLDGQSRGGQGAKTSDARLDVEQEHERWLTEARRLRDLHPKWSARRVAGHISPTRPERARKVIAPLWN